MRALALLVIVIVAFLAVRWLAPGPDPVQAGGSTGEPAKEEGARFLPPPERSITPSSANVSADVPAAESSAEPVETRQEPARFLAQSGSEADELLAARALAHGTPADVQAAAVSLPPGRALLFEVFSWAVAGEKQMAHSLAARLDKGGVADRERTLLEIALQGKGAVPAAAGAPSAIEFAMEMALRSREAQSALAARDYPSAARAFSDLLKAEVAAPFAPDPGVLARWTEGVDIAQREHRWNPMGDWAGAEVTVASGDSLIAIRKRYLATRPEARMCTGLIERSNRLAGFLQPGQKVRIPDDPVRVVVDLEARWALYFLGDEVAAAWPVGIGRPGEETPAGSYTAIEKTEKPSWMKVGQEPIPFGDPRNPLGTRWIGWARGGAKTTYGFHGTKEPESIGRAASDGCVRFLNEDVEELFQILPEGTPILVQG
jgi:hypothetical protein